ncbi:DUF3027 domain-containing protein [Nocardia sp. bgisy118]|uniref:DUF3027 domain-containing protein n=1 Tax=Nocardia sp. bgisy118 TaxID=3413786 RepID=UPI003F4A1D49
MSAVSVSEPDVRPVLAEAVDLARRALLELEPSAVGAHLGVSAEDESAATHRFEATLPGYRGWQWAVVVAAPPDADRATVSESALLPGPDALVAPDFVPWEQRIRPGDLSPGDLLAPAQDDPRLAPGYVASSDPEIDEVALEIGLGRTKVLSEEGRVEAAERWYSEYGPDTDMAKAAPATCGTCGFYLPLAGALRAAFGVCGNAMGADGRVVHAEYGCGAHSDVVAPTGSGSPLYEAYDDAAFDVIPSEELGKPASRSDVVAGDGAQSAPEAVSAETAADEGVSAAAETEAQVVDGESVAAAVDSIGEQTATIDTSAGTEVGGDSAEGVAAAEDLGVEQAKPVAETAAVAEPVAHPEAIADATTAESAVAAAVDAEKDSELGGSVADETVTPEQSGVREAAAEERTAADAPVFDESANAETNAAEPVTGEVPSLDAGPAAESVADVAPAAESVAAESVIGEAASLETSPAAESVADTAPAAEAKTAEAVTGEASMVESSPAAESVTDAALAVEPGAEAGEGPTASESSTAEPGVAESVTGEASTVDSSPAADATPAPESGAVSVDAGDVQPSTSDDASAPSESNAAEPVTAEVPSLEATPAESPTDATPVAESSAVSVEAEDVPPTVSDDASAPSESDADEPVTGEVPPLETSPAESLADATPAAESTAVNAEADDVQPSLSEDAATAAGTEAPASDVAAEPGSTPAAQAGADDKAESRPESGS